MIKLSVRMFEKKTKYALNLMCIYNIFKIYYVTFVCYYYMIYL